MSFVAQIQADIANFEKNIKKAVDTTNSSTSKMESKFGSLNKSFLKIGVGAAAFGAAVVAAGVGLTKLAISAGDATAKINNLSEATNLSTDVIQELTYVAKASNSSFEGLTGALSSFQRTLKTADEEGSKTNETLAKLGVSTTDASGNVRSMDDVLIDTFKSLGDMEKGLKRNAIGTELFRGAWRDVALIVSSGADGIENLRKEANQLGLVLDKDTLKSADNFATAMGLVGFQVETLKTKIGASLVPILENTLLPLLQDKVIPAISKVVDAIVKAVENIIKKWGDIVDYFTTGEGAEMWNTIRKAAENLRDDLTNIFKDIEGNVLPIWDGLGKELSKSFGQTTTSITSAINFIVETFDNFLNILRAANPKEALEPTKKFFVDFANGIKEGLSPMKEGSVVVGDLTDAQKEAMVSGSKWGVSIDENKKKIDDLTPSVGDLTKEIEYVSPAINKLTANNLALNKSLAGIKATMGGDTIGKWIVGGTKMDLSGTDGALTADSVWNVDNDALTAKMQATADIAHQNVAKMNEDLSENIIDLSGLISGAVTDFAGIIGEAFAGDFSDFGANLLDAVGSFAQQFGALLIAAGIASKELQALITNPFAAIAAGVALVALGAFTSKKAQSMTKSLTSSGGGYSSAPSMQTSSPSLGGSEYRGAYRDDFKVQFSIGNDALVATLDTAQQRRNRI